MQASYASSGTSVRVIVAFQVGMPLIVRSLVATGRHHGPASDADQQLSQLTAGIGDFAEFAIPHAATCLARRANSRASLPLRTSSALASGDT